MVCLCNYYVGFYNRFSRKYGLSENRFFVFKEEKMIRVTKIIFVLSLVVLSGTNLFAQGDAAVPFLLINPGARPGGMGEAGVAYCDDATAIYWNPALLAFQYTDPEVHSKGEVSLMHVKWLPQFNFDDLWYDYLATRYYFEDLGMFGLSITYLNLGENVATDETGNRIGTFDSFEYAITASYATLLKENMSLGVNLKFIQSNLTDRNITVGSENRDGRSSSFALDVGFFWRPAYEFLGNRLGFGANLSNFGPKMTYIDEAQADPLPTNLRLGLSYKLLDDEFNKITLVYDTNKLLVVRDEDGSDNVFKAVFYSAWAEGSFEERLRRFTHSIGAEYWYGDLIALRAGYFYEDASFGARKFLTFGGGLKYYVFGIDFGYISAEEDHPLSDTMRFSLSVQF
jgi:hypothetical protein